MSAHSLPTAIVTGASRGIGLAITKKLLAEGWRVIGTSTSGIIPIDDERLVPCRLILDDRQSIADAAARIGSETERIDLLVNNAGVNPGPDPIPMDLDVFRAAVDVDLLGPIELTEGLLPLLGEGSRVINVTSQAGSIDVDFELQITPYRVAKAGLNMYTKVLNQRLEKQGACASLFDPGWVRTNLGSPGATKLPEEAADELYELVKHLSGQK